MGDKELKERQLLATNRNTEALDDIAAIEAKRAQREGIDKYLEEKPTEQQQMYGGKIYWKKIPKFWYFPACFFIQTVL